MTLADLRSWSESAAQRDSPVALAVRTLLKDHDALRRRAAEMANETVKHETRRIDLEIAQAANKSYAAELTRLRGLLDTKAEWEK